MKIASYDGSAPKIRVTDNPVDYLELGFKHPEAIRRLRRYPGHRFSLDKLGLPKRAKPAIVSYISGLYRLNNALGLALRVDERPGLTDEIHGFFALNRDPRLPENVYEKKKSPPVPDSKSDEKLELGTEMDLSPKAQAMRAALAQKRRDLNEFYLKLQFLHPLAMAGMLSADPAYATTILSANNFGIKDENPEVRLASVKILGEIVRTTWMKFQSAKLSDNLPVYKAGSIAHLLGSVTFEELRDDTESLNAISNALTQGGYGVFDSNGDVKVTAEIVAENSFKTQKVIRRYIAEQGYGFPGVHKG